MATVITYLLSTIAIFLCPAFAFDPRPQQDICVADLSKGTNPDSLLPLPCMDPTKVTADHFYSDALRTPGNTNNPFRAAFTALDSSRVPGRNTLGMTVSRLDVGPAGFYALHAHPRAAELFVVVTGQLEVGFVTSTRHRLYKKVLSPGDVFYVPLGLLHYQRNPENGSGTVAYSVLNSQSPGLNSITHAAFGASPSIDSGYLADAFQLDVRTIRSLQGKQWV
ncbi:germin-like protein 1 [Striga asiatica]|uniref:Germin-like protein n=1 Tax=Striga asiatica TaxID=4170 RepID=A0A5A7QBN3_STRAF|nr:germin-like protein 1 [Striga asiatica]